MATSYFDHYARMNDLSPRGRMRSWRYYGALLAPVLPHDRNARILDIGCGAGLLVEWLVRRRNYANVVGIDRDPGQVEFANQLGLPVALVGDTVTWLQQQSEFELVIMNDVLEHIPEPHDISILEAIRSKVSADGVVLFRVPNASSTFGSRYRYIDATHSRSYTEASLHHDLLTAGFSEIRVSAEPFPTPRSILGFARIMALLLTHGWRRLQAIAEFGGSGFSIPLSLNLVATCRSSPVK